MGLKLQISSRRLILCKNRQNRSYPRGVNARLKFLLFYVFGFFFADTGSHLFSKSRYERRSSFFLNARTIYCGVCNTISRYYCLLKIVRNFKRPKNCEDSSDFDDFRTKRIAAARPIFWKTFERTSSSSSRRCRRRRRRRRRHHRRRRRILRR